jgi:hypothetical protein
LAQLHLPLEKRNESIERDMSEARLATKTPVENSWRNSTFPSRKKKKEKEKI